MNLIPTEKLNTFFNFIEWQSLDFKKKGTKCKIYNRDPDHHQHQLGTNTGKQRKDDIFEKM